MLVRKTKIFKIILLLIMPFVIFSQTDKPLFAAGSFIMEIKYGKFTIIGEPFIDFVRIDSKQKSKLVNVICDCGNKKIVNYSSLIRGISKSCGCYKKELAGNQNKTHGLSKHKLFKVWQKIKERCYYSKDKFYKNYGGRGIYMCEDWKNDFKKFYDWSVENGWKEGLQIDRTKNNGNYEPSNCRYVTCQVNNRNQSTTKLNQEKADEIRRLYATGNYSQSQLGIKYNVVQGQISAVILNKQW